MRMAPLFRACLLGALLALSGCGEGPAEEAGEELDEAGEQAEEAAEEAGDD